MQACTYLESECLSISIDFSIVQKCVCLKFKKEKKMEELLKNVDLGIDFDMDSLDTLDSLNIDCIADDLLDLNEDDLLNIDLLTSSEYEDSLEDQESSDEELEFDIDSFFVSEKQDEKEFKKINKILNKLTNPKDSSLNSQSINNLMLLTSINSSFNSNYCYNLNSTSNQTQLNSNCTIRSQNQCFNRDSSYLDSCDASSSSSDEEQINFNDNQETSQLNNDKRSVVPFSISYYLNDKLDKRNKKDKKLDKKKFNSKKTCKSLEKLNQTQANNQMKRKLSSSKGTSLLAKTNSLKKIKDDLSDLNDLNESEKYLNYSKFLNYFYQDHNYCTFKNRN